MTPPRHTSSQLFLVTAINIARAIYGYSHTSVTFGQFEEFAEPAATTKRHAPLPPFPPRSIPSLLQGQTHYLT